MRTEAKVVLMGVEPSSHDFGNLTCHLHCGPQPVTLINSYAVKED